MIAQEFHVYDEDMLSSRLFYLSNKVQDIWRLKAKTIEEGRVYIGG